MRHYNGYVQKTEYKGYEFDCKQEARVAVFFDKRGYNWQGTQLTDRLVIEEKDTNDPFYKNEVWYTPDFYVDHSEFGKRVYYEVKTSYPTQDEILKAAKFCYVTGCAVYFCGFNVNSPLGFQPWALIEGWQHFYGSHKEYECPHLGMQRLFDEYRGCSGNRYPDDVVLADCNLYSCFTNHEKTVKCEREIKYFEKCVLEQGNIIITVDDVRRFWQEALSAMPDWAREVKRAVSYAKLARFDKKIERWCGGYAQGFSGYSFDPEELL